MSVWILTMGGQHIGWFRSEASAWAEAERLARLGVHPLQAADVYEKDVS
jgi:hypothetical protein